MSAQASPDMANRVIVAAPKGQRTFAQGAAKKFEDMPKFEQVKGPGPKKLALPEPPKEVGERPHDTPVSLALANDAVLYACVYARTCCGLPGSSCWLWSRPQQAHHRNPPRQAAGAVCRTSNPSRTAMGPGML